MARTMPAADQGDGFAQSGIMPGAIRQEYSGVRQITEPAEGVLGGGKPPLQAVQRAMARRDPAAPTGQAVANVQARPRTRRPSVRRRLKRRGLGRLQALRRRLLRSR